MGLCRAALLILCVNLTPARAETPLPAASIGEITYGTAPKPGEANCTGTLIAPDLVLTAAHCLPANTTITFSAGQNLGTQVVAVSGYPESLLLPAKPADPVAALANDLGLLRLDAPIPADQAQPLPLTVTILPSSQFTMIAYRRDAPHAASINSFCRLVQVTGPILGLTCPVASGNSGAPLLVLQNDAWHLAAVMVAQSRAPGALRSYAVIPGAEITAKITAR